ncbi:MAG: glycosyl transferase family 2 [Candidatus Nomurabacteria bacterium]|nr:glycosyl transferase family 2 [Candidatus Nomurabacteria bacterium]
MNNNVDVVIPVYNGAQFIVAALESVVRQTLRPQQIIVIDDGSTDNTNAIVSAYAAQSSIPVRIVTKENAGLSSARNAGIRESTADYIAFLDADDLWTPTKLAQQLQLFEHTSFSRLGLVYCDYDVINTVGNPDMESHKTKLDTSIRGKVFLALLKGNKILSSGSGVLIKREVFTTIGTFDETLRYAEDWDMWLRIAKEYEVDVVPEVLVHIRRHDDNMTADNKNVFVGETTFYKKWIPILKKEKCPVPLKWSLKTLYRILMRLPKTDLIKQSLPVLLVPFR